MRFNQGKNNVLQWRDADKHFKLRSKMAAGVSHRHSGHSLHVLFNLT